MKILLISTTMFQLPIKGYGGTEAIVMSLAKEFYGMGHQVSVVAPEGSILPTGVELIPTALREMEESAFIKYRDKLKDFDIIHDHSFGSWCYLESMNIDPPLPIVKTFHTDPSIWSSPPPTQHPCLVGISKNHARELSLRFRVNVEYCYNGIDLDFYKPPVSDVQRSSRFLFLGRYTIEKNPLALMQMCKRLKVPLDCYGDVEIVGAGDYVDRCRREADEVLVRFNTGVSREKTVELYQKYKALLYTPTWQEPFGLTLAESQACGMPVVGLRLGSVPEIVKDGETGFICDDVDGVGRVITNGDLKKISPDSCVSWISQFSTKRMAERYMELFQRVRDGYSW